MSQIYEASKKAWEKYDPEFSLDDEGNQILHKEGDDGGKEALFNYYDLEETFLEAFWLGVEWAAETAARKEKTNETDET
jgi:TfoX/Sxy family transcriptional regulator of competence genes